jgi:magnesium chelatase subunit D
MVEREGVSWNHECRFLLMVPWTREGSLSSHLMDRFDICVTVNASDSVEERKEVLRRACGTRRDR